MSFDYRINYGQSFDFYQKVSVSNTTFGVPDGYKYDILIPFSTYGVQFLNLGSGIVEYSFNGFDIHGELNPANPSAGLTFDNRVVSKIWFRVQTGSSGPIQISVQAWGIR